MVDKENTSEHAPDGGNLPDAAPVIGDQAPTEPPAASPPTLSLDDYRRILDRLDAAERELAARAQADAVAAGEVFVHPNTHILVLANGDTLETANPSVTHVATHDDTIVPVVARHELKPAS
jgi:hypothetical protein